MPTDPSLDLSDLKSALQQNIDDIVEALHDRGWVSIPHFLEPQQVSLLLARAQTIDDYTQAGIGRGERFRENHRIRTDKIFWQEDEDPIDNLWLSAMESLRTEINRHLFLGLFEFESHYAHYEPGDFYARHMDAFKGQGNRLVTTVFYLNPDWQADDGGALVLYPGFGPEQGIRILPEAGTLVVFLSEDFPHEVLPANRDRYSITGWFRLNATTASHLDVPA